MAIDWSSIGTSAITGGINSAFNGLLGMLKARQNWNYTKKNLALQQKYAKEAFDWQVDRDNWLLRNQAALTKAGLKAAGYSVADPSGTGAQLTGMSSPSADPSNGSFAQAFDMPPFDMMASYTQLKQGELMDAQKKLIESQAYGQDIENRLRSLYGDREYELTLGKLDEETKKIVSERLYTEQKKLNEMALTAAQIEDIEQRLAMSWGKMPLELRVLAAQEQELISRKDLNEAQIKKIDTDIKVAMQQIELLKKECNLTDAQVDVAIASAFNQRQQGNEAYWRKHYTKQSLLTEKAKTGQAEYELDVLKKFGVAPSVIDKWNGVVRGIVGTLNDVKNLVVPGSPSSGGE